MRQIQVSYGCGDVSRFLRIEQSWLTFSNRTKATMPGADIPAQHEGRSTIRPALKDVWTLRFLTNGVKVQPLNQLQKMILIDRIAETNPEPFGFRLPCLFI